MILEIIAFAHQHFWKTVWTQFLTWYTKLETLQQNNSNEMEKYRYLLVQIFVFFTFYTVTVLLEMDMYLVNVSVFIVPKMK